MVTVLLESTKSLVTSSVKIGRRRRSRSGSPSCSARRAIRGPLGQRGGPRGRRGRLTTRCPERPIPTGRGWPSTSPCWGQRMPTDENAPVTSRAPSAWAEMEELRFIRLSEPAMFRPAATTRTRALTFTRPRSPHPAPGAASASAPASPWRPDGLAGLVCRARAWRSSTGSRWSTCPDRPGLPGRGQCAAAQHRSHLQFRLAAGDRVCADDPGPDRPRTRLESDSLDSTARGEGGFGSSELLALGFTQLGVGVVDLFLGLSRDACAGRCR